MVRWLNRNENLSSSSPNCLRVGLRSSKSEEGYSSVAEKEMITMNMSTRYINYISLAVLLINGTAFDLMAQEEQRQKGSIKKDLAKISQNIDDQFSKDTRRDPFTISEHLGVETQRQGSGIEFFPSDGTQKLPNLKLRGYIGDKEEDPMALLDVEGKGVFLVRKGDTVGLQMGGRHTVIKVKDITNLSIFVEVGTLGQVVIVR